MFDKLKLLLLKAAFDTVCKQRDELKDTLRNVRAERDRLLKENVELGEKYHRVASAVESWRYLADTEREKCDRLMSKCADMEQNAIRLMSENQQLRVHANAFVPRYVQD